MLDSPQTASRQDTAPPAPLQLLLFVDERPSSQENIQQVKSYLQALQKEHPLALQVIDIREQPHLVEYFRLVATPALVKIAPKPRHTLAGSNLVQQLQKWFPRWQATVQEETENFSESAREEIPPSPTSELNSVGYSGELMRLSDEIFRLQQEKEELLSQLKFKEQVLAMLVHDLRSPLTAASIAVETLELAENQPALKEQLYQQARKQFRIMSRLITDILQTSKAINAELQVQYSQLFLQDLCPEIVNQFARCCQEKDLAIAADIPHDLPPVYADAELIRQVIVNLLENALKYTPAGGKISLSIIHRTSQKVQVIVCDTGPGIPEEKRERIFEGHFRLQRDEGKEGYGLGLSLCRQIVRAHYGQIWVESTPHQGSCFQFTLPVYR